ncbi:hypothetical protein L226DRAFT_539425 [Lentinus tigrinus ALCF2SS1-7]|uniref:Uncharacterized protein n=1 Tax=Lentinus tigrinus ALCF2SS1-6 TaxID=1328759 RepID=A0A5C2SBU3_9APHY|nr:hypothetical protein L227DRAFT_654539 [Lentinus tigrinus ALCF2SS1-6]RPD69779.1 hypothetical protein L226DRAFT_539425 [Lentinus tigrinus ALCF2SS1-7]
MGLACDVYTKLMFHRGHGYPLWEPEPTKSGEVLIGDVGYVLEGSFYRLFNATLPADHAIHERYGVPDAYEPFTYPDSLLHRRASALQPGPICSKSVLALNVEASAGISGGGPGIIGQLRFKCADEQGAVLVLKDDAAREALHPSKDLTLYIVRNHESWHRFALDVFRLDLGESDILFVSGCIKTGAWALAAATNRARDGELVFGGSFGVLSQATFSVSAMEKITIPVEHRSGPKRLAGDAEPEDKRDQCVFLHYYKCKRRRVLGPKVIRAASEEQSCGRASSPDDPAGSDVVGHAGAELLEFAPGRSQFCDPVDDILDYILDNTDTLCAVASDQDVNVLIMSELGLESMPDDVQEALQMVRPAVEVVEGSVGMLQANGASHALPTISESDDAGVNPTEAPTTNIWLSSTPGTPPQVRSNQGRIKSPGLRRQRSFSMKLRSCTPTPHTPPSMPVVYSPAEFACVGICVDECVDGVSAESSGYNNNLCSDPSPKRSRARPPGSKNKKTLATVAVAAEADAGPSARAHGRASCSDYDNAGPVPGCSTTTTEPPPKRKRGRPPKKPRAASDGPSPDERSSKRRKAAQ